MERVFVIGHKDTGFVVCINLLGKQQMMLKEENFKEGCLSFSMLEMSVRKI